MNCSDIGTSDNGVQDNRKDSLKYEYCTVVKTNQPTATYETVSIREEDASETASKTSLDKPLTNPIYSEVSDLHSDPQLEAI